MTAPTERLSRRLLTAGGLGIMATLAAGCVALSSRAAQGGDPRPAPGHPPTLIYFEGWLSGGDVVPPVKNTGGGSMKGMLTRETNQLEWNVNASSLSGPATAIGLYGPAPKGQNGPLVAALSLTDLRHPHGDDIDEFFGTLTLTPLQAEALVAGRLYISVSTKSHLGGELRGQVVRIKGSVHGV